MSRDEASRKWLATIANPQEHGFNHERIIDALTALTLKYFCMADEIGGETGLYHTHLYLEARSPLRFSTLHSALPSAHLMKARGTALENKSYIQKSGKWQDSEKAKTCVAGSFYEWGELDEETPRNTQDKHELLFQLIQLGYSTDEIIKMDRSFIYRARTIDDLVQRRLAEKYKTERRNVKVSYIWGPTGSGKTKGVMDEFEEEGVCRITSYGNSKALFDSYANEPTLVFEEFNSQIPLEEMLNYLDMYPLRLPARYNDRVACYTRVIITSNLPIECQYVDERVTNPGAWAALLRRIKEIRFVGDDEATYRAKSNFELLHP